MGKKTDDLVAVFWIVEKSNIKKRNQILLHNDELYHHSGGNADRAPLRAQHIIITCGWILIIRLAGQTPLRRSRRETAGLLSTKSR
jgi:hypothetical protein